MFKVNDFVVYNSMGVYKITDIRTEKDIYENDTQYYIMQPVYHNNMTVKVPVDNPNVKMREVISREEVLSLIDSMPEKETVWIPDDRKRNESFKAALKTGKCEEWFKLIKSIYAEKQEKTNIGKKLMKIDEEIMKAAQKNLYEEFAVALEMSPDDIEEFILEHVS